MIKVKSFYGFKKLYTLYGKHTHRGVNEYIFKCLGYWNCVWIYVTVSVYNQYKDTINVQSNCKSI